MNHYKVAFYPLGSKPSWLLIKKLSIFSQKPEQVKGSNTMRHAGFTLATSKESKIMSFILVGEL